MKKTALIVLDGWGRPDNPDVSAIDKAHTPFVDSLYENYPQTWIKTSGLDVGLPDGQMGNSEVGHMNLGAGRVVYQDLVKINLAAENGDFANDPTLQNALAHAKATRSLGDSRREHTSNGKREAFFMQRWTQRFTSAGSAKASEVGCKQTKSASLQCCTPSRAIYKQRQLIPNQQQCST